DYGKLGNVKISSETESRIGENQEKKNQRDFAVWKFSKELGYDAPFGRGFPGWHIECTAMSTKYLGSEFDVHTGGIDHIPVHHNNEIAQAVCSGSPYAHYWLHNAHLNMGEEKMAKSGENFITLRTLKDRGIDPLALRYIFLSARYSSPLQFSWEALEGADSALNKIRGKISEISETGNIVPTDFQKFINDDLDTPRALALVWEVLKDDAISDADKKATILDFDRALGLKLGETKVFEIPDEVKELIAERDTARKNKDFTKSDELREKIESFGFEVKDSSDGTTLIAK
ncbi:MAG: cysteine--tRNA ligase, partial [Minisyncoccia bacterium]